MPLATWQTAEGEEFEYYVPRGASVEAQAALGKRAYYARRRGIDVTRPPPVESTIGSEFRRGTEQALSSLLTAGQSVFGDPEEAAREALARQEDIDARYGDQGPSLGRLQDVAEREGILAAIGEGFTQIPRAVAQQVPQLVGTGITAGLGTLLGGPVGGVAGASAFITPQMAGSNIMAQATEQLERGQDLDIGVGKAFGTGLLQTAPELLGQYFIVGRGITGKLLGIDPQKLTTAAQRKAAADKLLAEAQRGFRRTAATGVAQGAAGEASTEVFQQILERAQAGQDLLSPEAIASYGEAAFLGGTVGGALGPIGSFSDRSAARNRVQALKDMGLEEPPTPGTALVPVPSEPPPAPPSESLLTGEVVSPPGPLALSAPEQLRLPAPSRAINVGPEGTAFPASLQDLYDKAKADEAEAEREVIGATAAGAGTPESVIRRRQEIEERRAATLLPPQREMFDAEEAPTPPAPPRTLTAEFLTSIGVSRNSALVRGSKTAPSIVGKDLTNPAQRDEVAATITQYLKNPAVTASGSNQGVNLARLLKSPVFAQAVPETTGQEANVQNLTIDDQIAATQEREALEAAVQQRRQEQAQREAETQQAYQQREDEQIGQAVAERIAQRPEGVPTAVGAAMQQAEARGRRAPGQAQLEIPAVPPADPTIQAIAAEQRAIEAEAPAGTAEAGPAPVQGELIGPRGGPRTRMAPAQAAPEVETETAQEAPQGTASDEGATTESSAAKARRERAQAKAQANRQKQKQEEAQRKDSIKAEAAKKARSKPAKPADKNQQAFDAAEEILEAEQAGNTKRVNEVLEEVDADIYDDVSHYTNYSKYGLDMDLPASAVVRTAASVDQEVFDLLKKNKLADALTQMAKMRNKSISRVASALAKVAGTTKVRFEAGLLNDRGEPIAGKYEVINNRVDACHIFLA